MHAVSGRAKNKKVMPECNSDHDLEMDPALLKFFPQTDPKHISDPAVIIDRHGVIMVWYLPGIISLPRTVRNLT